MSNILIVSGSYYPYASANAVCVKEFERAFVKKGHSVTYVIKRHDIDTERKTTQDGVEIYHVPRTVEEFYTTCEKMKRVKRPQLMEILFKISLFVIKGVVAVYAKFRYGSVRKYSEKAYINEYVNTITQIVKDKKIDIIVSVSMPFLSHVVVKKYLDKINNENIKWIPILFDAYSQAKNVEEKQVKIEEELGVMRAADKVIFLDVLKESYEKMPFLSYANKFRYVSLPLLDFEERIEEEEGIIKAENKVDFVFAGTLYDNGRSLSCFLEFVKEIDSDTLRFHFMGKIYPKNLNLLKKLQLECRAEIIIYGMMSTKFAQNSIKRADVVINMGNEEVNQIPSKVFRYISEQKIILNFYKIENDPVMNLLRKYPLAYSIYEKNMDTKTSVSEFKVFYKRNKRVKLDTEELKKIYAGKMRQDVCNDFLHAVIR